MNQQNPDNLHIMLCDDAYPTDRDGKRYRGRKKNPLACAECESPCWWGIEMLKALSEKEFAELLCGADCDTCRQPCNLRRIALMRSITWAKAHKGKRPKGWFDIALRPYNERMERST